MRWLGAVALIVAGVALADPPERSSEAARQALSTASGQALQGKAREAVLRLQAVPESEFAASARAVRNCMIERFRPGSKPQPSDKAESLTEQALAAYRAYWHAALVDPEQRSAEEERLESRLEKLLHLPAEAEWDNVEAALKARADAEGSHVLMGRTPPLLEFIVWKSQDGQIRQVPLPEASHPIQVNILDNFASLGWSAFATCERSYTGGWVGDEAIFAVRPGWKSLEDENFRVSFLAHETQHFADKQRFGELESWELEYRGKLTELALAETTLPRLIEAFESNQGDDPAVPHSYANKIVLSWIRAKLGLPASAALGAAVDRAQINRAARDLLARDTARRERSSED